MEGVIDRDLSLSLASFIIYTKIIVIFSSLKTGIPNLGEKNRVYTTMYTYSLK